MRPSTILLIHHSRTDVGYTEMPGRVARWHADFLRQALEITERDRLGGALSVRRPEIITGTKSKG